MASTRKRKKQAPQSSSFFSMGEDKQQDNPSQESKKPQEDKTQAVVALRPAAFHPYPKLPADLKSIVLGFLNYNKELPLASIAHGRSYLRNSDIYPRILKQLASNKKYTNLSRYTLAAVPSAGLLNHLFSSRLLLAGKLLNRVVNASYAGVALMIAADPSFMFEPVNFLYPDGNSERISPLKYAFKVYDTYMWKLFYESIKNNPGYVKQFLRQAQEQKTHINLEPLFEAYEEYEKQYQRWLTKEITDQVLNEEWFKVGKVQKARLPVHLLKEFSRAGGTWNASSAFDVQVMSAPLDCLLYDYRAQGWKPLFAVLFDPEWGVTFSLARGLRGGQAAPGAHGRSVAVAASDLAIFRRLFEVRTDDLTKGISQDFQETLEQQSQDLSSSSVSRVTP